VHGFVTLTVGDMIQFSHAEREYTMRVMEVHPANTNHGIVVVDTDLEASDAPMAAHAPSPALALQGGL